MVTEPPRLCVWGGFSEKFDLSTAFCRALGWSGVHGGVFRGKLIRRPFAEFLNDCRAIRAIHATKVAPNLVSASSHVGHVPSLIMWGSTGRAIYVGRVYCVRPALIKPTADVIPFWSTYVRVSPKRTAGMYTVCLILQR